MFATRPTTEALYITRLGLHYRKREVTEMATEEEGSMSVADMMKLLVEDRQRCEAEYAAERE